jgi:glycosyltransferase involved in cell wall biosynthesis
MASTWAKHGHAVTVLTTRKRADQVGWSMPCTGFDLVELEYSVPWYLERLRAGYKASSQSSDGSRSTLSRLLLWIRQQTGIFSTARMPDLTDWWIDPAVTWARQHGPWDIVVSSYAPYAAHLVARAVKREGLAPFWIADYRDLWTENEPFGGLFPFTWIEHREEQACLREANIVVTISEGLAAKLRAKSPTPVVVIPNGFDPDAHAGLSPEPAFSLAGQRRIVFTGTLYPQRQDPEPFLKALAILERESPGLDKRLALVVAGAAAAAWRSLLDRQPLPCVQVHDLLPRDMALRMQRDADALLLIDWNDPTAGVMTSKVFEYLPALAPIFLIGSPPASPLAAFLKQTGRGVLLPDDPAQTADFLRHWLSAPESVAIEPDTEFIARFSRERLALRFLELTLAATPRQTARAA